MFDFLLTRGKMIIIIENVAGRYRLKIYLREKVRRIQGEEVGKMKFYTFCSSCGHVLGRSGVGTETEVRCPKCGAELEYAVEDRRVTVTILRPSMKQQAKRIKQYSEEIKQ